MLDVKRTIENLKGIKEDDVMNLYNEIICAFDTTEEEIIVSSLDEMNTFNGNDGVHLAYENGKSSEAIKIEIIDGEIIEAWEA